MWVGMGAAPTHGARQDVPLLRHGAVDALCERIDVGRVLVRQARVVALERRIRVQVPDLLVRVDRDEHVTNVHLHARPAVGLRHTRRG
jgi:hypothetical protein